MLKRLLRTIMIVSLISVLWTMGLASAQDSINVGDSVTAELSGPTDYILSLEEGQAVVIDAVSADFDSYLEIFQAGLSVATDDDSGEGLNARLTFVAPATGDYTVQVRAFASGTGEYTLSVQTTEVVVLAYDAPIEVQVDAFPYEARINASAGDVINILAIAADTETDMNLALNDSRGFQVAYNDDGGPGRNPYIRRYRIPADGVYAVVVNSFLSDGPFSFTLGVETTEELILTPGEPITVTLGEELANENFAIEAVSGQTYEISVVTTIVNRNFNLNIEIAQPEDFFPAFTSRNSGMSEVTLVFTAERSGAFRVGLVPSSFSFDPIGDYTVTLTTR